MWKTLNEILPKKKKTQASRDSLTAAKFNQFFTSIAGKLRKHFASSSLPRDLTPRVYLDFALQEVSASFVHQELQKMKSTKATSLDGIPTRLLKDAAPEIAKPIAHLVNLTISTGQIPSQWKEAKVTPIFKSGNKDDENNYRPISVLSIGFKDYGTHSSSSAPFLGENNVLSIDQSGFRKRHYTETAIVHLTDHILEHMDKQQMTGSVFIDLKKAFDLVDHKCLLHKLEHHGVRDRSLDWFQNYLTTRSQRVKYGKDLSPGLTLDFGVPQGSLLGPLLFGCIPTT